MGFKCRVFVWAFFSILMQTSPTFGEKPFKNPVVPNATLGEFLHGTYPSPPLGNWTHPGIDLVAPCGSPIFPVADGKVIDLISKSSEPDFEFLGHMVIVSHPASLAGRALYSTYFHMQESPSVSLNQSVRVGKTKLGKVGRTGRVVSSACHTHFEIRDFPDRYGFTVPDTGRKNIYGPGDQRKETYFQAHWIDPVSFIAKTQSHISVAQVRPQTTTPQSSNVITNAVILEMVKNGLTNDIVIATIHNSSTHFDLSPMAIINLKKAGVSNDVIEAMLKASGSSMSPTTTKDAGPAPKYYGIYVFKNNELLEQNMVGSEDKKQPEEHRGEVKLMIYDRNVNALMNQVRLVPMIYVRRYLNYASDHRRPSISVVNKWHLSGRYKGKELPDIPVGIEPNKNNPEIVIVSPRTIMKPGAYAFVLGGVGQITNVFGATRQTQIIYSFFVDKDQVLAPEFITSLCVDTVNGRPGGSYWDNFGALSQMSLNTMPCSGNIGISREAKLVPPKELQIPKVQIGANELIPGVGIRGIQIGDEISKLKAVWGEPEEETERIVNGRKRVSISYRKSGTDKCCGAVAYNGAISSLYFYAEYMKTYRIKATNGIDGDATEGKMREVFGPPDKVYERRGSTFYQYPKKGITFVFRGGVLRIISVDKPRN